MKKSRGFTIVEILIVIAVLGILFTIVSVAWITILRQGEDDTRYAEQQEWVSRFETYRGQHGVFPNSASATENTTPLTGEYCLGTGFPGNRCKRVSGADSISTNDNAPNRVMQELAKVGTLPDYQRIAVGEYVGPWADYRTPTEIRVYQAYDSTPCPGDTTRDTALSEGVVCYITLRK